MNMDFTISSYKSLLEALISAGYSLITFQDYLTTNPSGKFVILRHDVDELAGNALKIAIAEHELGVRSTFYFRVVKQSNHPEIIRQIVKMGHEVGYHYEDLSAMGGDYQKAIESFEKNVDYFRQYYPVKTVCMHGSSTSKYDNRTLWQHYYLEDYGVLGEPYISIDFDKVFYLTDTGFAWDGGKYAVRDIVVNNHGLTFHSTEQIVRAIRCGKFPQQSMILAHTLWSDNLLQWTFLHCREWLRNSIKGMAMDNAFVAKIYSRLVKAYWKR